MRFSLMRKVELGNRPVFAHDRSDLTLQLPPRSHAAFLRGTRRVITPHISIHIHCLPYEDMARM